MQQSRVGMNGIERLRTILPNFIGASFSRIAQGPYLAAGGKLPITPLVED